jgi:small conductance mechanosensitive channel
MSFPLLAQVADFAPANQAATQPWPAQPPMMNDPAVVAASIQPVAGATAESVAPPVDAFQQLLGHLNTLDVNGWEHTIYKYGLKAVFVLILLTVAWTVSGWGASFVRTALDRINFDETLSIFLSKLVRWAILVMAVLICLSKFDVETTSFAALIGATGLAIGLAFQGTLSNFAAGAMLLLFRPYKVGDEVNVAGYSGTVREIELFTTAIDTGDFRRIIVPNSSIFGSVIENVTHHPVRRFDVGVGTAYSADIDETRRVLERAVQSVIHVVPQPAPAVVLLELGASSVNWSVRGWAKRETHGDAKQAVIRAVKMELDQARIGIPFPQLDLHLDPQPEVQSVRRAA